MDYEEILFGLKPLLTAESLDSLLVNDDFLQKSLQFLDNLAVSLRSPENRDLVRDTGIFGELLRLLERTLASAFGKPALPSGNTAHWRLSSELIRCVANCLVDNDTNRHYLLEHEYGLTTDQNTLFYYISQILELEKLPFEETQNDQLLLEIHMRSIVTMKNLCLDNESCTNRVLPQMRTHLLKFLEHTLSGYSEDGENVVLASDLLVDCLSVTTKNSTSHDCEVLANCILQTSASLESTVLCDGEVNDKEEGEENEESDTTSSDPDTDILFNISQGLEIIVSNQSNLKIDSSIVPSMQEQLLSALDNLSSKIFTNKLIIMRRIMSIAGHISANLTCCNRDERNICLDILKTNMNDYTVATALLILTNSISERADVDAIIEGITLEELINVETVLKDPFQYQGYLDILKKVFNMNNAMFLQTPAAKKLFDFCQKCSAQLAYFENLSPLLDSLLKKVITVFPSSTLLTLATAPNSSVLRVVQERGSVLSCLLLDKLLVARTQPPNTIVENLLVKAFKFEEGPASFTAGGSGVSVEFLFQMTKTVGIYIRNCELAKVSLEDILLFRGEIVPKLDQLLATALNLKNKPDNGSKSVFNNGRFIAGIILNLSKIHAESNPQLAELVTLSGKFF
ncbi:Bem4p KNAG_0G02610 [Huiozyma naganishii CBS 8797]|uniref:SWI5-dependent HO expression protein 4 n=1 Tax=Huiozyma naganishii (strain ATCC MYA-139 / BCRC 22969 / CBS 8797 / KCTC 17520 / NBRC 10181 / NCYC 3082 / Yp74L-3) TaxID=1071383 RepID=J7S166_HUIN7|nr:hypothetical protein KNAG_0G02610 [Kazachstania naganishii CBS 8797]CCK71317.1 hypothetical protein KNAG_0G02610 [Kazachstania naganishii CBS 8797]